jgi:hypothetical protein
MVSLCGGRGTSVVLCLCSVRIEGGRVVSRRVGLPRCNSSCFGVGGASAPRCLFTALLGACGRLRAWQVAEFLHRAVQISLRLQSTSGKLLKDFQAACTTDPETLVRRADPVCLPPPLPPCRSRGVLDCFACECARTRWVRSCVCVLRAGAGGGGEGLRVLVSHARQAAGGVSKHLAWCFVHSHPC